MVRYGKARQGSLSLVDPDKEDDVVACNIRGNNRGDDRRIVGTSQERVQSTYSKVRVAGTLKVDVQVQGLCISLCVKSRDVPCLGTLGGLLVRVVREFRAAICWEVGRRQESRLKAALIQRDRKVRRGPDQATINCFYLQKFFFQLGAQAANRGSSSTCL